MYRFKFIQGQKLPKKQQQQQYIRGILNSYFY